MTGRRICLLLCNTIRLFITVIVTFSYIEYTSCDIVGVGFVKTFEVDQILCTICHRMLEAVVFKVN